MGSIVHISVPTNLKWSLNCSHAHALFQDGLKDVQVGSRWSSTLCILSPNFHRFSISLRHWRCNGLVVGFFLNHWVAACVFRCVLSFKPPSRDPPNQCSRDTNLQMYYNGCFFTKNPSQALSETEQKNIHKSTQCDTADNLFG